jgi:hypothetical protein
MAYNTAARRRKEREARATKKASKERAIQRDFKVLQAIEIRASAIQAALAMNCIAGADTLIAEAAKIERYMLNGEERVVNAAAGADSGTVLSLSSRRTRRSK